MVGRCKYGEVQYFPMARTFAGRGLYWTGVYYLDSLLIDSGPPNLAREVERLCRELSVRACMTTHHHEDHCGNHAMLYRHFGIKPLVHRTGVDLLTQPVAELHFYRRLTWGVPAAAVVSAAGDTIEAGRFTLDVIHTPGHAPDHVVLYERQRGWLFSGDLFLANKLKYAREDEDIHQLIDSLQRVIALEPEVLFCQHRGRLDGAAQRLGEKLDFLLETGAQIEQLKRQGKEDEEIARALPWGDWLWRHWTGGHFSKLNLVRGFLRPGKNSAPSAAAL